ncbi:MAG: AzlD domain-containing protein [Roseburia sp.]|nr:AzlD domain-containing protein [Roseburia sp.]
MNFKYCLLCILIMALVTYLPRVLPITLFRGEIRSRYIRTFLDYTPYAVLGALTFPEIFYSTGNTLSSIIGTAVALLLAYLKRGLVVVAVGAILAAYLSQILF